MRCLEQKMGGLNSKYLLYIYHTKTTGTDTGEVNTITY